MITKSNLAYKTIGEATRELGLIDKKTGVPQTHTLRYWEKQFKQLNPKIRAGKRRYYSKKDFQTIKQIKFLLKEKGLTINGVKKFLKNESTFNLDESSNRTINTSKNNLKAKLKKISNLVKEIKSIE